MQEVRRVEKDAEERRRTKSEPPPISRGAVNTTQGLQIAPTKVDPKYDYCACILRSLQLAKTNGTEKGMVSFISVKSGKTIHISSSKKRLGSD